MSKWPSDFRYVYICYDLWVIDRSMWKPLLIQKNPFADISRHRMGFEHRNHVLDGQNTQHKARPLWKTNFTIENFSLRPGWSSSGELEIRVATISNQNCLPSAHPRFIRGEILSSLGPSPRLSKPLVIHDYQSYAIEWVSTNSLQAL